MDPQSCAPEVIARLEEQLGKFGIAGRIELDGKCVRLRGHGATIVLESAVLESWTTATSFERQRTVERIVRELVQLRRAQSSPTRAPQRLFGWLKPIFVLALLIAGLSLAWKWLGKPAREGFVAATGVSLNHQGPGMSAPVAVAAPPQTISVDEHCRRVQARVATGGSVNQLDVDGWVVELSLMSSDPTLDPTSSKLDPFLAPIPDAGQARKLVWAEDDELRATGDASSFAVVSPDPLVDVLPRTRGGLRITWSGRYVNRYFDAASRVRMQRLAAAIYEATGSQYGALYARCTLGTVHQVGSWFRGKDSSTAVLALIAAMGAHAEVAHLEGADPRTATPIEQRRIWDSAAERAKPYDRQRLTLSLADDGGLVAAKPGAWVTLTFPYQDANRATRASLRFALQMGLSPRM